ncbi:MAG: NAD(P)/FAD-dependent oxidoreductase [Clostridia bacterium]|nr:NAD(P)/FAD-dependent oxidoreductase [Clostridia bacterium]MBO5291254.1 NAD(P)/FAD-dependent oxidoreductase [Clostridia bacterium]
MDLIVIGGGAAGLMAAGTAAQRGLKVTLIERNDKLARKVAITGKGRCNVTNSCPLLNDLISNVPVNGRFLYGAFSRFTTDDTIDFFEGMGVPLKIERGNRVFPVSDKALDIVDALNRFITVNGVKRKQGRVTELIIEEGAVKGCITDDGRKFYAENVLIATGGKSYPATGSTGDGYELAKQAGHTITDLKPSLVPLECHEGWCTEAMGLSLRNVEIRVEDTKNYKEVYKDFGEMLFTHFGVSGPMILSASSHMRNMERSRYVIHIDFKPALTYEQLDKRLQRDLLECSNKNLYNTLSLMLPRKMIPVIVKLSGLNGNIKSNQVTKEMRSILVDTLKDIRLTVTDFRPIDEAIITSGGVSVSEIDPKTMKSKITEGLYFAGEVIDVDAYTGGFNLQIAFSTGRLAGNSVS